MLPIIPGAPLVFFGLWLIALTDHYQHVGWPTLSLLAAVVLVTVAVDFVASALGAKKVGASRQEVTGALLGSVIGIFFGRSEEHTYDLQSLMRISYSVFWLTKKNNTFKPDY